MTRFRRNPAVAAPVLALALFGASTALAVPLPADPKLRARLGMELGRGEASYYGPGFHGRRTASGERFNSRALTAAHRTLPFGTRVRVENLRTGRSVNVRINDRGPFTRNRVIDLSEAAGSLIGLDRRGQGVAPVRITLLGRR